MPRLLLVDDEPMVLDVQQQLLSRRCPEWETACASGGEEALEELRTQKFDVVIADLRMPGIDGATLLARVRDDFPATVRILQSGHSDRNAALRAVSAAHVFLPKPTQMTELESILGRVTALQELTQDVKLQEMVGGAHDLPSVPKVYLELTEIIAREDSSLDEISEIIESDVAMCARMLQISRSAFFGLPKNTTSIKEAVAWLGLELVKALALAAGVFRAFKRADEIPEFSIQSEQSHAIRVSRASQIVGSGDADELFMAGMLHDVGKLVLADCHAELYNKVLERARIEGQPSHLLEMDEFGITHAEVGAHLLNLWGLPHSIVEAVAHHHVPSRFQTDTVDVVASVHFANALVREVDNPVEDPGIQPCCLLDTVFANQVGATDRIPQWFSKIKGIGVESNET